MASKVKIIPPNELKKMHTGSFLARRKKLLQCEESFSSSDRFGSENEPNPMEIRFIEFKDTDIWKKSYQELKDVLATREHRDRK